jgi:hypothetical protein
MNGPPPNSGILSQTRVQARRFFQRLAVEDLVLWTVQCHDPAGTTNDPGAVDAVGRDRAAESTSKVATFDSGVAIGMSQGADEISGEGPKLMTSYDLTGPPIP